MSRAGDFARSIQAARQAGPPPFIASGDEHPAAVVDEEGYLVLMPRLTRLMPVDVQRFVVWLHAAFDEEPF